MDRIRIIYRSFFYGKRDYFRATNDQTLELSVHFEKPVHGLKVFLNTDIDSSIGDLEFYQAAKKNCYSVKLKFKKSGLFSFRVRYSINNGDLIWDNVPRSHVLVNPKLMSSVRMYTLIPSISGHFGDWINLLGHIKRMNFNVVHLLPITKLDSSKSPYATNDFFSIDERFGIPEDDRPLFEQFEDFVNQAKRLELKLCFDIVLNHVGYKSKLVNEHPEWIVVDDKKSDGFRPAGCWDNFEWITWGDSVLLEYQHPDSEIKKKFWNYMEEYAFLWADYANRTGGMIRFDNLHSTDEDFLHNLVGKLRNKFSELTIFSELFVDNQTAEKMVITYGLNLLLVTPWFFGDTEQTRKRILFLHKIQQKSLYLMPLTSHDSGMPAEEYGSVRATIARYAVYAMMGTGHTGMSQGGEFGLPEKINFIGVPGKIEFSSGVFGHDFCHEIGKINQIVRDYPAFNSNGKLKFIDDNHPAIIAALKYYDNDNGNDDNDSFIVIANFDDNNGQGIMLDLEKHLGILSNEKFYDELKGQQVMLENKAHMIFAPGEIRIFKSTRN